MGVVYYKVINGKYTIELPKGKFGNVVLPSYRAMRKAVKSTYKLKKKKR